MTLSDHFRDAMIRDLDIVQHLFAKIPEASYDFRPQENMRSVRELLQYLTYIGGVVTDTFLHSTDHAADMTRLRGSIKDPKEIDVSNFHQLIEDQKSKITELFSNVSDEDLQSKKCFHPWGEEVSLFDGILNGPVKYLASYRMQLFIYLKQLGQDVNTANNWRGIDWKPAPKPETLASA